MEYIIETTRLKLRKLQLDDYKDLCVCLQDIEVMYAWEHAFSNKEVQEWIEENIRRYKKHGFSYYAVIEKKIDKLIGVAGIVLETADNEEYIGIGYIFSKQYWSNGYAYESAKACMDYAFSVINAKEVTAQIRPNNKASIRVAEKLGMIPKKEFVRVYNEKEMPHILYSKVSN